MITFLVCSEENYYLLKYVFSMEMDVFDNMCANIYSTVYIICRYKCNSAFIALLLTN